MIALLGGTVLGSPRAGAATRLSPPGSAGGASEFSFSGLSCLSATNCLAVGDYANASGASVPLSEEWNGSTWGSVSIHGPKYSGLDAISCPDASYCMAVGYARYGPLAETWNGTAWSRVKSPHPAGSQSSELLSVSCPTSSDCSAVGVYQNDSSTSLTLAEQWNGESWTLIASPNPSGVTGSELTGVSCAHGTAQCVAVGYSFGRKGNSHTLAESWNGAAWSLVASPNDSQGSENELLSVSCVSATDCTAVGDYTNLSADLVAVIETWNGTSWSLVPGAQPDGELVNIDCVRASMCMAVGFSSGTFTDRWNGKSWTVVPSPNQKGSSSSVLDGVSCAKRRSCDAVGYDTGKASDTTYTLAETWNGSAWSLVPSPNH